MHITPKLRAAMRNLLDHAQNEVGLIMRWNRDDALIETVWSEGYRHLDEAPKLGFERKPVTLVNLTKTGFNVANVQPAMGGHAEEIMIRNWEGYKRRLTNGREPQWVDLILTHSPCWQESSMHYDENGHLWPAGCGPKLADMIKKNTFVKEWHIGYFAYYGSAASVDNAMRSVAKLESIRNVATYFFHGIP